MDDAPDGIEPSCLPSLDLSTQREDLRFCRETDLGTVVAQMQQLGAAQAWVVEGSDWVGSLALINLLPLILSDPEWQQIPAQRVMTSPVLTYPAEQERDPKVLYDLITAQDLDYLPRIAADGSLVELVTREGILAECLAAKDRQIQTLMEEREVLQAMVEAVPGAVYQFAFDQQGQPFFPYISTTALHLYDCTSDDLIQHPLLPLEQIYPEDRPSFECSVASAVKANSDWRCEYRILTLSGQIKWILGQSKVYESPRYGRTWLGVVLEITDRKQIETELIERNELIESIANGIPGFIQQMVWTPQAQKLTMDYISRGAEDVTGYPVAEIKANLDILTEELVLPEYQAAATTDFFNACVIEKCCYQTDIAIRNLRDEIVWLRFRAQPHSHADGSVYINSIAIDITEQIQAEQDLKQAYLELRYEIEVRGAQLQEALHYESTLRRISDQVRASLNEQDIIQTALQELGSGLDLEASYFSQLIDNHLSYKIEQEWAMRDTTLVGESYFNDPSIMVQMIQNQTLYYCTQSSLFGWITLILCPISLDDHVGPEYFLALCRSQSDPFLPGEIRLAEQVANQCAIGIRQARLYQKAQHQVRRLEELNQLKEDFIHTVSHELRTPLTSMKMAITMLKISQTQEQRDRYHQILEFEWNRELNLVNELLELQALESGTRSVSLSCIQIPHWVRTLVEPFSLRCQDREQHFKVILDPDAKIITTDQSLLERVVVELLNNACKYTPPHAQITLNITAVPQRIQFQVINTGVTIPAEYLGSIFEKFQRIQALDRYNQGGTGLGLALVKKVVETLQGSIQVESAMDTTIFTIELPSLVAQSTAIRLTKT